MIQILVEFYRAVIAIILVVACICALVFLAFGVSTGSSFGFLMAVGVLAAAGLAVGTSAVLLSINDHLAAIRGALSAASDTPLRARAPVPVVPQGASDANGGSLLK